MHSPTTCTSQDFLQQWQSCKDQTRLVFCLAKLYPRLDVQKDFLSPIAMSNLQVRVYHFRDNNTSGCRAVPTRAPLSCGARDSRETSRCGESDGRRATGGCAAATGIGIKPAVPPRSSCLSPHDARSLHPAALDAPIPTCSISFGAMQGLLGQLGGFNAPPRNDAAFAGISAADGQDLFHRCQRRTSTRARPGSDLDPDRGGCERSAPKESGKQSVCTSSVALRGL